MVLFPGHGPSLIYNLGMREWGYFVFSCDRICAISWPSRPLVCPHVDPFLSIQFPWYHAILKVNPWVHIEFVNVDVITLYDSSLEQQPARQGAVCQRHFSLNFSEGNDSIERQQNSWLSTLSLSLVTIVGDRCDTPLPNSCIAHRSHVALQKRVLWLQPTHIPPI